MPATYSKKRHGNVDDEEELPRKHGGGPLKRTGQQADEWDECVGPSLGQLSPHRLPTKREVLQRYRALRIQLPNGSKHQLATLIAGEVFTIWANARWWEGPDDMQSPHTLRTTRALEVREWAEQQLLRGSFGRDDYRELCELIVVFLGGEVNNSGR